MTTVRIIKTVLRSFRHRLRDLEKLDRLRRLNPDAQIGNGVRVLGDPGMVRFGNGSVVEDGVVLDLQHGGEVVFGANASIRSGAVLSPFGGFIRFGDHCGIQHYTIVYGHGGCTAGNYVRFAAHCLVVPANHGTDLNGVPMSLQPLTKRGVQMGDDIWVGGGSRILDGVTIGNGAVIAAGAVVNKDVEADMIVGGIPARPIRGR